MFLLVPAYPGCPGSKAVKRSLLLLLLSYFICVYTMCLCVCWCWCVVVRVYCKASKVLQQYEHMPSFHGIQQDCQVIVQQLRARLMQQFHNKDVHNTHLQLLICFFADHFFSHLLFFVVHIIFHNSLCFPEVKFCLFLIWGQHPSRWYFVKCLKFGPCRPL